MITISRTWVAVAVLVAIVGCFWLWQQRAALLFAYHNQSTLGAASDVAGALSGLGVSL